MIAYTPSSAAGHTATIGAADSPVGRDATSRRGRPGTLDAIGVIARIQPDLALDVRLSDGLARVCAIFGRSPQPGRHATQCPNAEDAGHEAECVFDTRMHGAVLVRPTGERVAA